jgi:hypothetical protein
MRPRSWSAVLGGQRWDRQMKGTLFVGILSVKSSYITDSRNQSEITESVIGSAPWARRTIIPEQSSVV